MTGLVNEILTELVYALPKLARFMKRVTSGDSPPGHRSPPKKPTKHLK